MRTMLAITVLILLTSTVSGCIGKNDIDLNLDDEEPTPLRINHIQMKGTHNSYHLAPLIPTIRAYDYSHQPLDVQAEEQGVRQFEIDVWWDARGQLYVYHNQYDLRTTCTTFEECLNTLLNWSNENTEHVPLMIWIEPKEWVEQSTDSTIVVELQNMLDQIEEEITQFWPRNKTITPDDVRGESETLSQAIMEEGWPLLDESRGKAIFILLSSGDLRENYHEKYPGLINSRMFTMSNDPGSSEAAIFSNTDPIGNGDEIIGLIKDGYIVRSRADNAEDGEADNNDTSRLNAAISVGAHSISTDYPSKVEGIDYWVDIPNGNPVACNPISAPIDCTSERIESL
ncbi:MAG: phosphatidylinositol-specific phospholipase C1-like protein [Candidatus Thalassarchaeaceae archaeon]|nr:phosphatidylinositol-specific phospholipase C1-like protein [Candidatus Thalassarchaeaceae archaeon]